MSRERKLSSTAYPIPFFLASAADGATGVTGLGAAPTVTLSKNCGAFGAAAGAVSEIGGGWYALAGNATDRDTLGSLIVKATGANAIHIPEVYGIVTKDPFAEVEQTGDSFARIGATGSGLTTLATAANLATVAGYIDTEVASILAAVDTEIAAIKAKTDNLPASPAATGDVPSASAVATAVGALDIDGAALTERLKYLAAVGYGTSSGMTSSGGQAVFNKPGTATPRVTADLDSNGNRTAVATA